MLIWIILRLYYTNSHKTFDLFKINSYEWSYATCLKINITKLDNCILVINLDPQKLENLWTFDIYMSILFFLNFDGRWTQNTEWVNKEYCVTLPDDYLRKRLSFPSGAREFLFSKITLCFHSCVQTENVHHTEFRNRNASQIYQNGNERHNV